MVTGIISFDIAFLWCKNIQGIEWYNFCNHTMYLCGYMLGKWRKVGFSKKDTPVTLILYVQNKLCGFIFSAKNQRKVSGNNICCFFIMQKHPGNRMICFTWPYDASMYLQVTKMMKKWIFLQILVYILCHFWPPRKFWRIFFRVQKKQGETCPKFKPSRLSKVLLMFFQKN